MIFLVHHLLLFFKSTLTVPKIKDLVNVPQKKYEDIYNILSKDSSSSYGSKLDIGFNSINDVKQETKVEISSMKNELKSFLKKQLNNGNSSGLDPTISSSGLGSSSGGSTSIETLDAFSGSGSGSGSGINFSAY
jgi:hypothetical protein